MKNLSKKNIILLIVGALIILGVVLCLVLLPKSELDEVKFDIKVKGTDVVINNDVINDLKVEKKKFTMNASANKKETSEFSVIKLSDVLKKNKLEVKKSITYCASDGFCATLEKNEIDGAYIGLIKNGEAIEGHSIQMVVPDKSSKYWVKDIVDFDIK